MNYEANENLEMLIQRFGESRRAVLKELSKVIIGQSEVIDQILAAVLTRGHCLLVGVPGLAKTLIVSSTAAVCDVSFRRIQFTPDLMPADITGTNVIDEENGRREFRFVKGPVFAHFILADEINRTPPKTQAALLESMQERQVTVSHRSYPLPDPFVVIATQNPIEQEGTYPLPEAQQDRFMFNIFVDYPLAEEEEKILAATTSGEKPVLKKVVDAEEIIRMQRVVTSLPASEYVVRYCSMLVRATRPGDGSASQMVKKMVDYGAGPRAGQYLLLGAKAFAAMDGRLTASIEDVRRVAVPVLRHRIGCNFAASTEGIDSVAIIRQLVEEIPEPEVSKYTQ